MAVQITALLSIAQELSDFHPQNATVMVDGQETNGWRLPAV
ncbi:hypothetical protein [Curtobacterium sp. ISL-83]|nr:hypothetical protein [Curtobacterium sp. ISL-83]